MNNDIINRNYQDLMRVCFGEKSIRDFILGIVSEKPMTQPEWKYEAGSWRGRGRCLFWTQTQMWRQGRKGTGFLQPCSTWERGSHPFPPSAATSACPDTGAILNSRSASLDPFILVLRLSPDWILQTWLPHIRSRHVWLILAEAVACEKEGKPCCKIFITFPELWDQSPIILEHRGSRRRGRGSGITGPGMGTTGGHMLSKWALHRVGQPRTGASNINPAAKDD